MTLYIVRHATASVRTASRNDIIRPLDQHGRGQAQALAERLGSRPIEAVLSSPATRCLQTITPLADQLGLEIQVEDELWEIRGGQPAYELVRELGRESRNVVLCSHGDVIPAVLEGLREVGMEIGGRCGYAKGSVWEIEFEDGVPVLGRYQKTAALLSEAG